MSVRESEFLECILKEYQCILFFNQDMLHGTLGGLQEVYPAHTFITYYIVRL